MEKSPHERPSEKSTKFYVTTPIYYVNDIPHVGHAYTTVVADVLARWHRMRGDDVFFLTGLDENSVKTVQAAHEKGFKDIQKYADAMAENWRKVWRVLNISNDGFIRTTEDRHKKVVEALFMKIYEKGDIYKGKYEGLYCDGCEAFLTESDLVDGKCPLHNKAPKRLKEENYFFKLSKYQNEILQHIEKNPDFIQPKSRQAEIVSFIKGGLKDISISRPNLEWGIRVPIDPNHTIWVWFDALTNYISGAGEKRWPADLHIIGKDLVRFHCMLWPAMLLSAGYELPKRFLIHGFLTVGGQKISKSLGNVIDPVYMAEKYSADAVRYFLIRDVPFGEDGDFSENAMKTRLNDELADIVGNLVHRSLLFICNNFDSKVPRPGTLDEHDIEMLRSIEGTPPAVGKLMEESNVSGGLREIIKLAKSGNKYFNDAQPWRTVKENSQKCATTLYVCAQLTRSLAITLAPYLPSTSQKLWGYLNLPGDVHKQRWDSAGEPGIKEGHRINRPAPLFAKIQHKTAKPGASGQDPSDKRSNVVPQEHFSKLDIRVGEIRAAEQVAGSNKLLKLSIEVDGTPHTAVAGISEHYKPGELIGKKVAVVMNLPPVRLMGVVSECMILAAEDEKGISILTTDKPVKAGARVK